MPRSSSPDVAPSPFARDHSTTSTAGALAGGIGSAADGAIDPLRGLADDATDSAADTVGNAADAVDDSVGDRLDAALTASPIDIPPLPDMPPAPSFDPEPFTPTDSPFGDDDAHKRDLPPPPFSS